MERKKPPPYLYLLMTLLAVVGVMEVIFLMTYMKPSDGVVWAETANGLVVDSIMRDIETPLQVGDILHHMDDQEVRGLQEYEEFLFLYPIGSKHLYSVNRDGGFFEPWVTISGIREKPDAYFFFAVSGFVFLIFSFLIIGQNLPRVEKNRLIFLSLCIYMTFVFYRTDLLTPLDWVSFILNLVGVSFLGSCFFESLIGPVLRKNIIFRQLALGHWVVSIILFLFLLVYLLGAYRLDIFTEYSYADILKYQQFWTTGLCMLSLIMALTVKDLKSYWGSLVWVWTFSFSPFFLYILKLSYPFDALMASTIPAALPIAIFFDWNRTYRMFLGGAGRQVAIYSTILLSLFLGFFLFFGLFYQLLAGKMSSETQLFLSSFGIVLAAVAFTPLKASVENFWNKMVYGARLGALQNLLDMASINRADTSLSTFFSAINLKIQNGFGIQHVRSFVFDKRTQSFCDIDPVDPGFGQKAIVFPADQGTFPTAEKCGLGDSRTFLPQDLILPMKVGGTVVVFLHLSNGEESLQLSQEESQLLKNLVNQCEVLLENIELYQDANEKALRIEKLREFNESIIESSRVGLVAVDEMGLIVSCNQAFKEIVSSYHEDPRGLRFRYLLDAKQIERSYLGKKGQVTEGFYQVPSGQLLQLELQQSPLKSKDNEVYGTLYLVEDIHERKKRQEKMMQQEKLASIGLLAAGVAHEINTPLTGIHSYAQMLIKESMQEEHLDLIKKIQFQSLRAGGIVRELLNFTRKDTTPFEPVELRHIITQTFTLLSHSMKKNQIEYELTGDEGDMMILGNANQLQQVFVNIIVNAVDSMASGGRMCVRFSKRSDSVNVEFEDNGCGMKEELVTRIFDPFFTTKEAGKGTGLGLSIVYNICQEHNAEITVRSKLSEGTRIIINFPRRLTEK